MKITKNTEIYNDRRWGKPWIARVTFDTMGNAEMAWGNWVGTPGEAGMLIVEALPGQIVACGQKDHRGNKTETSYYSVAADGSLSALENKLAAFKASLLSA